MTEFDPLAEVIVKAYEDTDPTYGTDHLSEWKLADWQAAAKAAREFIAAEDDDWTEVSEINEIHRGDEVQVIQISGDRTEVRSGVAYSMGNTVIYTEDGYHLVGQHFDQYTTVRVRRAKQEPPTAPLIMAYEVKGEDFGTDGRLLALDNGVYRMVHADGIIPYIWNPSKIIRYATVKAVVDG